MKMVMNRNITVVGLSGHAIKFVKGIPTNVPRMLVDDARAKGAIPAEGEEVPEVVEKEELGLAPTGEERVKQLRDAFGVLVAQNNRGDFAASSVPKMAAVKRHFKYPVDGKEVSAEWKAFKTALATEAAEEA